MTIDYAKARHAMVEQQVRPWWVLDARVLDVLARLPREGFVPEAYRAVAYADLEIPLGHGQHMLKPVVAGRALHNLLPQDGEEVLEIGTGSGYVSACWVNWPATWSAWSRCRSWPKPRAIACAPWAQAT